MMAPSSNPTRRVIQILDFLAARPGRGYGAAELCRSLELSKSTGLAIIAELAAAGYLIQDPTNKAYWLGPALITGGQAVFSRFPDFRPGLKALESAVGELGVSCSLVSVAAERIIVLARVGSPDPFQGLGRLGTSIPFIPPWGASLVAWGRDNELDEWLARAFSGSNLAGLHRSLHAGRRRGYFVVQEPPESSALHADLVRLRSEDRPDDETLERLMTRPDYFIDNLVPEETYRLSVLDVPILLNAGSSPLSLNATLLGKELSGSAIELLAHRLMDGARACAAEILATR